MNGAAPVLGPGAALLHWIALQTGKSFSTPRRHAVFSHCGSRTISSRAGDFAF